MERGQGQGPRKCSIRRTDIERRQLQSICDEEKRKQLVKSASSLPPVAGIITSHSNFLPSFLSVQDPLISLEDENKSKLDELSPAKVLELLRNREQPITMFGEDDDMRLSRLKNLAKSGFPDPKTDRFCNDTLPLDLVDFKRSEKKGYLRRDNKSKRKGPDGVENGLGSCNGGNVGCEGTIPSLQLDVNHEGMKTGFDNIPDEYKILVFFKQLLKEWESELQKRPESEKRTDKGRSNVVVLEHCALHLTPLFNMCRNQELPNDIGKALLGVVTSCLQRDYLQAMTHYITLALHVAPCPIGVTMVDIHESAIARERMPTSTVAPIADDDTTRKYLQSVKRLMTLCQRRYPAVLSKSVEYNGVSNKNSSKSLSQHNFVRTGNHIAGERSRFNNGVVV